MRGHIVYGSDKFRSRIIGWILQWSELVFNMEKELNAVYCPCNVYRQKLFLTPKDLMELLDVSESLVYKYLENPPFRVERIGGKKIVIFANSFWDWYDGKVA